MVDVLRRYCGLSTMLPKSGQVVNTADHSLYNEGAVAPIWLRTDSIETLGNQHPVYLESGRLDAYLQQLQLRLVPLHRQAVVMRKNAQVGVERRRLVVSSLVQQLQHCETCAGQPRRCSLAIPSTVDDGKSSTKEGNINSTQNGVGAEVQQQQAAGAYINIYSL